MEKEYEKAVRWLNQKAMSIGGITPLAKQLSASNTTFYRVLTGGSPPTADKFLSWIEQLGAKIVFPDQKMEEFSLLPKVMARAGAGSSLATEGEVEGMYAFRNDFLALQHISISHSVMLDVMGNSMEPLISNGDTILVDQSDADPRNDCIYLVGLDEELMVKRLQKIPGGWKIHSENPRVSDIEVTGEYLDHMRVYGRARWFGRVM